MPSTTNPALQTADSIIKFIIFDVVVNAAVAAAQAEVPFLALPIVRNLFSFLVGKVAGLIYTELETNVSFAIIDHQTQAEAAEYEKSKAALYAAHLKGEQDAIEKAKADFRASLGKLIHYDGS